MISIEDIIKKSKICLSIKNLILNYDLIISKCEVLHAAIYTPISSK